MRPRMGTSKTQRAANSISVTWMRPMSMQGMILPVITSSGVAGVASGCSKVPRSRSRVIASPVMSTIVSMTPSRPGTTL